MKATIALRKLSDLDVKYVSLVERGANRIPFRIIKSQEKDMSLDLSMLGFRVKKQASDAAKAEPATVSAVILSDGDAAMASSVQEVLKAQGLELTEHTIFEDGTVALHKLDDAFAENGTIVRLNSSMAVVLDNMGDHLAAIQKSAIGEQDKDQGYYDGPSLVMSSVQDAIHVGLQKAEGTTAASTLVRDAMESANQYMEVVAATIPSNVLKAEAEVEKLVKAFTAGKKGVNPFAKAPAKTDAETAAEEAAANEEIDPETGKKKVPVVAKKDEVVVDPAVVAAAVVVDPAAAPAAVVVPDPMEKVLKAMTDMASGIATLTKTVGDLSTELQSVKKATEEKIDVLAKKTETAVHAVRGTVLASDLPGDPQPIAKVKKTDDDPRTGVFDSAMLARNR